MEFDEEKIKLLTNKIRVDMNKSNYSEAIKSGLRIYNNKNFNELSNYYKYVTLYNLALCYKKNNMYNEAMEFVRICLPYSKNDEQFYHRLLWLMNECVIFLKIDTDKEIISRYLQCSKYYKKINSKLMRAYVLYNIAKYKKDSLKMFMVFKVIINETNAIIPTFVSYNKRADVLEMLNDIQKISENAYKNACNYLNIEVVDYR